MAALYRQFPLPQGGPTVTIRVLELLLDRSTKARPDPSIRFKFHFIKIGDGKEKPYMALSYVWGSEEESPAHSILVHGHRIAVRQNLWDFLHQERTRRLSLDTKQKEGDLRYLWIDAICIEQNSVAERNHQVSVMGNIYSEASKVLVWLGKIDLSFEQLRQADRKLRKIELRTAKISGRRQELKRTGAQIRKEMEIIFSNEYWSRMWIVQEYLLAHKLDLMAGADVLEGCVLARLCQNVSYKSKLSTVALNIIAYHQERQPVFAPRRHRIMRGYGSHISMRQPVSNSYMRDWRGGKLYHKASPYRFNEKNLDVPVSSVFHDGDTSEEDWIEAITSDQVQRQLRPLKDLLLAFGGQGCKEQVDRVYALLSLVTKEDRVRFGLTPDYSKSPSVLFVELAYSFCTIEGSQEGTVTSWRLASILGLQKTLDVEFTLKQIRKDIETRQVTSAKLLANKAQEKMEAATSTSFKSNMITEREGRTQW